MGTQESHIKELLVWIEDNLTNPLSLDIVAAKSGYTKWYLQRMFKKQTGLSLASYIRARRLYLAAFALRFTQKSILDISVEYQFDNQRRSRAVSRNTSPNRPACIAMPASRTSAIWCVRWRPASPAIFRLSASASPEGNMPSRQAVRLSPDIEKLDKSHLPQRSALRGNSIPCWASARRKPIRLPSWCRTASGSGSIIPGVTTEYPLREGVVLEPLPEIHGEFCRFRYSGKPVALNDHIIQIYTQVLPEMGLARGDGPDITVFSYSLSGKRNCIWSCSIWCRWCRCIDPSVAGSRFLLHDCRHHRRAISAGVLLPSGRPIGAWMRSSSCGVNSAICCKRWRRRALFLSDPMAPM